MQPDRDRPEDSGKEILSWSARQTPRGTFGKYRILVPPRALGGMDTMNTQAEHEVWLETPRFRG